VIGCFNENIYHNRTNVYPYTNRARAIPYHDNGYILCYVGGNGMSIKDAKAIAIISSIGGAGAGMIIAVFMGCA
jgi:hypothetical protein